MTFKEKVATAVVRQYDADRLLRTFFTKATLQFIKSLTACLKKFIVNAEYNCACSTNTDCGLRHVKVLISSGSSHPTLLELQLHSPGLDQRSNAGVSAFKYYSRVPINWLKSFFQSFLNTSPFDLFSGINAFLFFYKIEDLHLGSCITIKN